MRNSHTRTPANKHPIKGLFLTYPQCEETPEALLAHLQSIDNIEEYLICREEHQDGHHHLHAWVKFETGLKTTAFTPTLDLNGHHGEYQAARSRAAVLKYCKKDGEFITNIDDAAVLTPKAKRAKLVQAIKTRTCKELIEDGLVSYQSARAVLFAQQILIEPYEHDTVRGIWIYGPPGTGKSHAARNNYPLPVYEKSQNKWWDGYNGQPTVLIDDFDKRGECLDHLLKIWTDRYTCQGEIKGGQVQLRHQRFIVTSNYRIEDLWQDVVVVAALTRRFEFIEMTRVYKP